MNWTNNQLLAALITTTGAALIAWYTIAHTSSSDVHAPASIGIATGKVKPSPANNGRTASPAVSQPKPTELEATPVVKTTPSASERIPLLKPVDQPGWSLAWHSMISIGPPGIVFTHSIPRAANGGNADLQYIPGTGWNIGGNVSGVEFWSKTYAPGPATIYGLFDSMANESDKDPQDIRSYAGDRIYLEVNGIGIVSYFQVMKVEQGSLIVDMWVWDSS